MRHSRHLLVLCLQVLDELFNGKRISLDVHVLLILGFSPYSCRGKNSCQMLQCLVIVDSLCDEFLSELSRLIKILLDESF